MDGITPKRAGGRGARTAGRQGDVPGSITRLALGINLQLIKTRFAPIGGVNGKAHELGLHWDEDGRFAVDGLNRLVRDRHCGLGVRIWLPRLDFHLGEGPRA